MALEMQDLMALKSMGGEGGMTPYEQVKVGYMQNRHHTSGIGVAGLVLGTVGTAAAIGAWIFGPMYGNAKASQAREAAIAAKEQAAELSAVNSVMTKTYEDFVTGRASLNPTPVSIYSAPQPCACPGCGCNG